VLYRFPFAAPRTWRAERRSVHLTNLSLVALHGALAAMLGVISARPEAFGVSSTRPGSVLQLVFDFVARAINLMLGICDGLRLPMACLPKPMTCVYSCCYLVVCFVVGGEGAGSGRRNVAPAWAGFFSAFGFLASRFLRLRPLATLVPPVDELLVRPALRRVLLRAVRQYVPSCGNVLPSAGSCMTCTQQGHRTDQDEESESD